MNEVSRRTGAATMGDAEATRTVAWVVRRIAEGLRLGAWARLHIGSGTSPRPAYQCPGDQAIVRRKAAHKRAACHNLLKPSASCACSIESNNFERGERWSAVHVGQCPGR